MLPHIEGAPSRSSRQNAPGLVAHLISIQVGRSRLFSVRAGITSALNTLLNINKSDERSGRTLGIVLRDFSNCKPPEYQEWPQRKGRRPATRAEARVDTPSLAHDHLTCVPRLPGIERKHNKISTPIGEKRSWPFATRNRRDEMGVEKPAKRSPGVSLANLNNANSDALQVRS